MITEGIALVKMERRRITFMTLVLVTIAVGVIVIATRPTHDRIVESAAAVAPSTTTTTTLQVTTTTVAAGPATTPSMPVAVTVSPTSALRSGSVVTVHAAPKAGSQMFGVEARLCRGDASILTEGDFAPTRSGKCISAPLAAGTDSKVMVAGTPPYQGVDLAFRVGTGTDTFATQYDGTVSITCDSNHPCQIVLKLQYPDGFGFQGIPVTFG